MWTAISCHCWWQPSGLQGARLSSLTPANDGHPDGHLSPLLSLIGSDQDRGEIITGTRNQCQWLSGTYQLQMDEISQLSLVSFVYLSKCHPVTLFCCFTEASNLLTQTQGFCMLAHSAGGLGEWIPPENVCLWVQIVPWKFQPISSTFTPSKSQISLLYGMGPPPDGLLLSTLAPKWAAFTLTCVLNFVSQYHSYTVHIEIPLQHASVQHRRCRQAGRSYLWPGLYIGVTFIEKCVIGQTVTLNCNDRQNFSLPNWLSHEISSKNASAY